MQINYLIRSSGRCRLQIIVKKSPDSVHTLLDQCSVRCEQMYEFICG